MPDQAAVAPQPPTPPPPPAIPAAPVIEVVQGTPVAGTASPSEIYEAFRAQRTELTRQLSSLEERRRAIASRLRQGEVTGADKAGLESRLTELDARISEMYKEVAAADAQVARAAAQPGAVVPPPMRMQQGPPEEVIVMGFVLALTFLLPVSIAFARRIWRRGSVVPATVTVSPEMDHRLSRLEQAMDAVAVEVERIGEGQRYVTRMLGNGAAQPLSLPERQGVEVKR